LVAGVGQLGFQLMKRFAPYYQLKFVLALTPHRVRHCYANKYECRNSIKSQRQYILSPKTLRFQQSHLLYLGLIA
jgi:hypothetical protein